MITRDPSRNRRLARKLNNFALACSRVASCARDLAQNVEHLRSERFVSVDDEDFSFSALVAQQALMGALIDMEQSKQMLIDAGDISLAQIAEIERDLRRKHSQLQKRKEDAQ